MKTSMIHVNGQYLVEDSDNMLYWTEDMAAATAFDEYEARKILARTVLDSGIGVEPLPNDNETDSSSSANFDALNKTVFNGTSVDRMQIGYSVNISGIDWMLVNINANEYSFISKRLLAATQFETTLAYWDASIGNFILCVPKMLCEDIEKSLPFRLREALVGNVHLPSKNQLNGEWQYFTGKNTRLGYPRSSDEPDYYWTSTRCASGKICCVSREGNFCELYEDSVAEIRPAFTVRVF